MMSKLANKSGSSNRQLRVGEQIRQVISECLYRGDFYVAGISNIPITITEVRMSADLKHAFIFVMPLGGTNQNEIMDKLKEVSFHIRHYINKNLNLKNSPILHFERDLSFDEARKIQGILKSPEVARDL